MPGTTPNGYPYPTGGDDVRDGDNTIRALAEALPPRLVRQASPASGQNFGSNNVGEFRITFPTPFDQIPHIQVYAFSGNYYIRPVSNSTNGPAGFDRFSIGCRAISIATGEAVTNATIACTWSAVGVINP